MKTIVIANQKGGVGKTATATALLKGLSRESKVLGVDLDGQCTLTLLSGLNNTGASVLGVLTGDLNPLNAIKKGKDYDLIAASPKLNNADNLIETGDELKHALKELDNYYDYCVIDTPPQLSKRTISAIIAADWIVIPTRADLGSLQGIYDLTDTIKAIKATRNPNIKVVGILLTAVKTRATIFKEILAPLSTLAKALNTTVFDTTIRDSVQMTESSLLKLNIFDYAPKAKISEDYSNFIDELKERLNNEN